MSTMVELLMETADADTELLLKKDQHGDILSVPREVDFLLRAPSEGKAQLVADFINDCRYGEATAISDDGGHRISVRIVMPITQHIICSVSGIMACLSKLYELEYDGWGSVVKTNT